MKVKSFDFKEKKNDERWDLAVKVLLGIENNNNNNKINNNNEWSWCEVVGK